MKIKRILFAFIWMLPITLVAQELKGIDEIAPFNDGLAAVRQGNKWGFINEKGSLVIDFRDDLHWNKNADTSKMDITGIRYPIFKEGLCMVKALSDEQIPLYGFIDTSGKMVISPQFLNVTQFDNGYASGVLYDKVYMGQSAAKLKIYDFKFHDVLVDTSGKIEEYFAQRDNIIMSKRRYLVPMIGSKMISDEVVAIRTKGGGWEIRKLALSTKDPLLQGNDN